MAEKNPEVENVDGEVFEIKETRLKGLGAFAKEAIKRGSLILIEKPQCTPEKYKAAALPQKCRNFGDGVFWMWTVVSSFNSMNQNDQEEYMKLYDMYNDDNFQNIAENFPEKMTKFTNYCLTFLLSGEKDAPPEKKIFEDDEKKVLKILQIWETNAFGDGVRIKFARFNHSCDYNAVRYGDSIYAVSDIKKDEEITVNYQLDNRALGYYTAYYGMMKREVRQKGTSQNRGFLCQCDLCEEQKGTKDESYDQERIEELVFEIQGLKHYRDAAYKAKTLDTARSQYSMKNARREVNCYKKVYKLGIEKKSPAFLSRFTF